VSIFFRCHVRQHQAPTAPRTGASIPGSPDFTASGFSGRRRPAAASTHVPFAPCIAFLSAAAPVVSGTGCSHWTSANVSASRLSRCIRTTGALATPSSSSFPHSPRLRTSAASVPTNAAAHGSGSAPQPWASPARSVPFPSRGSSPSSGEHHAFHRSHRSSSTSSFYPPTRSPASPDSCSRIRTSWAVPLLRPRRPRARAAAAPPSALPLLVRPLPAAFQVPRGAGLSFGGASKLHVAAVRLRVLR
jgi:hypothetical protein